MPARPRHGHRHCRHDLPLAQIGRVDAAEEARGENLTRALGSGDADHGVEGEQAGGQLGGGISESHAAAQGAARANGAVAHVGHGLGDEWRVTCHQRGVLERVVPREGAHDEGVALHGNAIEAVDAIDVDEGRRRGQAHVERGHQTLPAGEDAAVRPVAREQRDGLVE